MIYVPHAFQFIDSMHASFWVFFLLASLITMYISYHSLDILKYSPSSLLWFQDRGTEVKEKQEKVSTYDSSSICDKNRWVRCPLVEDKEDASTNDMIDVEMLD